MSKPASHQTTVAHVERALNERGLKVLDRHWKGQRGQLDLITREGENLIVIETSNDHPAPKMTPQKLAKLRRLTGQWLTENRDRTGRVRNIRIVQASIGTCEQTTWQVQP